MRRILGPSIGVAIVIAMLFQGPGASSAGHSILEFTTMAPVTGPFVGTTNPIRGVAGGGFPWQIASGVGELSNNGRLELEIRGLVLFDGPPVPDARRGTNPIPSFVAIVSCLSIADGAPATVNVATPPFPATSSGRAEIESTVTLPHPCIAPIVFVGPNATTWFATTGRS
jgi:hypothetical protein